jgi:hypothetical protein
LLDDVGVAEAYDSVDFGDEQRVGDVQCDGVSGHVAVEQSESGDDRSIGERMTGCFGRFVRADGHSTAGLVDVELADVVHAALVEGQTTESGGQSTVVGDELWAGERKIGSYGGAPLAGHGHSMVGDVELVVVDDVGAVAEGRMLEISGNFVDDVELGETDDELESALGDVDDERVGHCDESVCADHGDDGDDGEEVVEVGDDASIGADNRMVDDERWVALGGAELELVDGDAAWAGGRSLESGAVDGEPSVEEQKIGSCDVPSAGHGQSLDDAVGAVAYG